MERQTFFVDNGQGWELCLRRNVERQRLDPARRPVLILPGYGMNAFIFGYHPRGTSMIDCWVERGHEVWTAELRGQGSSLRRGGSRQFGLAELALVDLRVALDFIVGHTGCRPREVIGVGCSLGGSLLYAHVACLPTHHVGGLVAMGAPLRWEAAHPLFKALSYAPGVAWVVGRLSRREVNLAALPLLALIPGAISVYLHRDMVDLSHREQIFRTVDDLHPDLNVELVRWIRNRDLVLRDTNITEAFWRTTLPLLCVAGYGDGIVPRAAALSAAQRTAGGPTELLEIGGPDKPYAHADLFVANDAPADVFEPVARWLEHQGQGHP